MGLLDFSRVRPHKSVDSNLHKIIDDSTTLVKLDRREFIDIRSITIESDIDHSLTHSRVILIGLFKSL